MKIIDDPRFKYKRAWDLKLRALYFYTVAKEEIEEEDPCLTNAEIAWNKIEESVKEEMTVLLNQNPVYEKKYIMIECNEFTLNDKSKIPKGASFVSYDTVIT